MPNQISLPAIIIANVMGLMVLFAVATGSFWTKKMSSVYNRLMKIMFIFIAISCIADPMCFIADGKPGVINHIVVFGCNTFLYLGNIVIATSWIFIVVTHLGVKLSRLHMTVIFSLCSVAILLLVVNAFTPIIFAVSRDNVYSRTGIYLAYYVLNIALLLDGLIIYFYVWHKSGKIKFFPAWAFVIPAIFGAAIQVVYYGVSTITPFITVSLGCLANCLKNEYLFKDKLTGAYNRFYLEVIEKRISKNKNSKYSVMMLDINSFKSINDKYGHKLGDKALVDFTLVLRNAISEDGEIIRYAGDEFIVILSTQDEGEIKKKISRINEELELVNKNGGNPYSLSAAIGYRELDFSEKTMDQLFDDVDILMYEDKHTYQDGNL